MVRHVLTMILFSGFAGCTILLDPLQYESNRINEWQPAPHLRWVKDDSLLGSCEKLREMEAHSKWGGAKMQNIGRKEVRMKLLKEVDQIGGNVLRIIFVNSEFMGAKGKGIAYRCPESVAKSIPVWPSINVD